MIPPHFDLVPIEKSEPRLNVLLRLIKRKDVSGLINACDAGREGELIFYIVQHAKAKNRSSVWLQSMTGAIRDGFAGLRPDRELLPLADAAKHRSEADWLVGINGTRAMTAFNNKVSESGFYKTTVGRVQTPTLTILVEREERIQNFKSRDYWEAHARFGAKAGEYAGRWFDRKKDDRRRAQARAAGMGPRRPSLPPAAARGRQRGTKAATQLSPLLFDLTSLQREANGRFGFSARGTLPLAQALHASQSSHLPADGFAGLPEDYVGTVKKTLEVLSGTGAYSQLKERSQEQLGQAQPAHFRQHEDLGSLRDHSHAAGAQASERGGAETLRPGCAALSRSSILPPIPADHARHHRRRAPIQDRGQDPPEPRLACRLRARRAGKRELARLQRTNG